MELFETKPSQAPKNHLETLPVSVLEIGPSGKAGIRGESQHDSMSSRSGYSAFPYEVAETCAALFLRDSTVVADPFAGWGERGDAVVRHGKSYIGFDLSPAAIENAKAKYNVCNRVADSRNVEVPEHDGLITCPPYWDLEKYESSSGLDRSKSFSEFLNDYSRILHRFADKAKPGATYCIATGDWRSSGIYYDLTFQTELIMNNLGFIPFDKVVISRLRISKVKIMLPQAKRLGYTVKVHEMLSVYKNPA
jgi:DNA modification methylase